MKKIKLFSIIFMVSYAVFNITISFTERTCDNISLSRINECAFANPENEITNATKMDFGCSKKGCDEEVPGCKHLPEDSTETCTLGTCSACGTSGSYLS